MIINKEPFTLFQFMKTTLPFNQRLTQCQQETGSRLCSGIDPDVRKLPAHLPKDADGVYQFCSAILKATNEHVCSYKFNSAFFEVLGSEGIAVLKQLCEEVPSQILTIYDVKRGDIGNTAKQYAYAAFDTLNMDAVTVNPYMGYDAVEPFIRDPVRGAFILCLTSNPGSSDFERLELTTGETLYKEVARKSVEWNANDNVGLVVGATQAESLGEIRAIAGALPILAPGVGAQGGDLEVVLDVGLDSDGYGIIVPVSRGILFAESGEHFAEAAGEQAKQYKKSINRALSYD